MYSTHHRLSKLSKIYGGYVSAYKGLDEIRGLFPEQSSLSSRGLSPSQGSTYPGNLDLYDFITTSAHEKANMIEL